MNKKWMVITLLLLGSTLQAGGHDYPQDRELKGIEFFLGDCMDLDPNTTDSSSAPNTVPQNSSSINESDKGKNKRKRMPSPATSPFPPQALTVAAVQNSNQDKINIENELSRLYNNAQQRQTPMDLNSNIASSSIPDRPSQDFSSINDNGKGKKKRPRTDNNPTDAPVPIMATTLPILPQALVTAAMQKTKNLKSSTLSRDKKTELECPYCKETKEDIQEIFSVDEQEQLIAHIKDNHTGERAYICPYRNCDKRFAYPSKLTEHRRTHTREKPYQCTHIGCNMAFTIRDTLTKHTRTHTGDRPYQCDYVNPITHQTCNKKFTQHGNLTVHKKTHTGEQPYKCTHTGCGKAFTLSNSLTKHTKTHTGEKPYQCLICNRNFTCSSNLTNHTRTHTEEEPFKCTTCNKGFKQSSNFTTHTKSKRHLDAVSAELALTQGNL